MTSPPIHLGWGWKWGSTQSKSYRHHICKHRLGKCPNQNPKAWWKRISTTRRISTCSCFFLFLLSYLFWVSFSDDLVFKSLRGVRLKPDTCTSIHFEIVFSVFLVIFQMSATIWEGIKEREKEITLTLAILEIKIWLRYLWNSNLRITGLNPLQFTIQETDGRTYPLIERARI